MRFILRHGIFLVLSLCLQAAGPEPEYPSELSQWKEVAEPPKTDKLAHALWSIASSYCPHNWRVFTRDGKPCAQLTDELPQMPQDNPLRKPAFKAREGKFKEGFAFAPVDDGWLVGFNEGEFGAALYWFRRNGKQSYKISGHQVVSFFTLPDGIYAIQGLGLLSLDDVSIIRIARPKARGRWKAISVLPLPSAPCAVCHGPDGILFVTLVDSLISVDAARKITTLLVDPPWAAGLYPDSSISSQDRKKLFIGMRQFVGEFDLTTKKIRLLVPSDKYLNKLSKEDEEDIRERYGK